MFDQQLNAFLACQDLPSLFQQVISRWEVRTSISLKDKCLKFLIQENFGAQLTENVLVLIASSRFGVTETMIQKIVQGMYSERY